MNRDIRLLVSAGERSGDLRAAGLLRELAPLVNGISLKGLGGDALGQLGLKSEYDLHRLSVVGFVEVIKHLPFFAGVMKRMEQLMDEWKPDRLLLVDYPGFNLRLASKASKRGIPVTYYISPQIWAWGAGRIKRIESSIDQMLVLFQFEEALYRSAGVSVEYVGHPLVDEAVAPESSEMLRHKLGLTREQPILGLLPGSRMQEVKRHLPALAEAAHMVPEFTPVVGLAPEVDKAIFEEFGLHATGDIYTLFASATCAVIASGTATLEAALLGTPMVVVYRTNPLSALLARKLIKIPYVAMVNVVADRMIVPEYLQDRFTPINVAHAVQELVNSPDRVATMKTELSIVARALGAGGASRRAAAAVASRLR